MAPPSNRRLGSSRRVQYGTFFGYLAAIAGALVGVVLLLVSVFRPDAFSGARGLADDVAAPPGRAIAGARAGSSGVFAALGGFFTSGARTAALEREVQIARVRLAEARAVEDENRRLKALIGLADGGTAPVARGRLIAATGTSTRRLAVVSVGQREGVRTGMAVRTPLGLVGRVIEAGNHTARVLLIADAESAVPVRRARDGVPAIAQGHGDGTVLLRLISLGLNPLKVGDVFVTSGSGGLYEPNVAVAVVASVTSDGAVARVLADPGASDFVAVQPVFVAELSAAAAASLPAPRPAQRKAP